jgi:hypothetical protein
MPGIAAVVTCDSSARRGSRVFDERECLVGLAGNVSGDRAALAVLCARLVAECVSVAVLGQFKRGKSSLPNARPGVPLPPTNVLPLSAVPRFIRLAEAPSIRLTYRDGRVEGGRGTISSRRLPGSPTSACRISACSRRRSRSPNSPRRFACEAAPLGRIAEG